MDGKDSKEDLITLRNCVIGVVGFATTVSAVLIQVFHFRPEPTIVCAAAFAILMLLIVFLIGKAERRSNKNLEKHIKDSEEVQQSMKQDLQDIKNMLLENGRSTLRLELNEEINLRPENHDTILRMGKRYFLDMQGDWVETDAFQKWIDSENAAGRKVNIPPALMSDIAMKLSKEKDMVE